MSRSDYLIMQIPGNFIALIFQVIIQENSEASFDLSELGRQAESLYWQVRLPDRGLYVWNDGFLSDT